MGRLIPVISTPRRGGRGTFTMPSRGPYDRQQGGYPPPQGGAYGPPMPPPLPPGWTQPLAQDQTALPANNRRDVLQNRRMTTSPRFLESVQRSLAEKGVARNRQAKAMQYKQAGIEKAGGNMTLGPPPPMPTMAPPAPPQLTGAPGMAAPGTFDRMSQALPATSQAAVQAWGNQGGAATTQPSAVPPKPLPVPGNMRGLKKFDDGSSETTLRWGTPGSPGETAGEYANAYLQQERNAGVMRNRGFSIPAAPFRPPNARVKENYESTPRTFQKPPGNYGLTQDQLSGIQRDADQQAYIGYQQEMAGLNQPPPPPPVPTDVAKQQIELAEQQAAYERQRAGDATRAAAVPRMPGQSGQARDTRIDALSKVYTGVMEKSRKAGDEFHKRGEQVYGEIERQLNPQDFQQPAAAATQPSAQPLGTDTQHQSGPLGTDTKHQVTPGAMKLTPNLAQRFLHQANGNRERAIQMAIEQGYDPYK